MDPRQKEIHSLLRSMLNVLGRDDVTVADVTEENGTVRFTLTEGKARDGRISSRAPSWRIDWNCPGG